MRRAGLAVVMLGAPIVALAVPAALGSPGRSTYDAHAVAAAKSAFERATTTSQQVSVPTRSPGSPQSAAALDALRRAGERRLAAVYAGPALQQERHALDNAIAAERDPSFRVLAGGVRRLTYNEIVVVSPAQVTIAATVETWWRTAQVAAGGGAPAVTTPTSAIDAHATVDRLPDGTWKVVSFTWKSRATDS